MQLRDLQFEVKTPSTLQPSFQKIFGQTTEFRNQDELDILWDYPDAEFDFLIQTQALLVLQRVLSRIDPDPNPFLLRRLLQYSLEWFRAAHEYSSSVDVVNFILELFGTRQWKDVVDYDWCYDLVRQALNTIKCSLWTLKKNPPPDRSQLPFEGFMAVINYITDLHIKLQEHPDPVQNEKSEFFVDFIADGIWMFIYHDKETTPEFQKWIARYIKFTNSHPGVYTVLHNLCYSPRLTNKIIKLFLQDGKADANAQDDDGDTPLHYLALNPFFLNIGAIKLLLVAGAHLDLSNKTGITPLHIFNVRKKSHEEGGKLFHPDLQELTRTVLPLSCLSAKVIRQNSIPLENKKIPSVLVSFIQCHSAL